MKIYFSAKNKKNSFLFFLLTFLLCLPAVAQIQWANAVVICSNENTKNSFSPQKTIGQPDVNPSNKPNPEAWTVKFSNLSTAHIQVMFEEAMYVKKVFIAENLGIGLKTILLLDEKGSVQEKFIINENYDFALQLKAKISHIILYKQTKYKVKYIQVEIEKPFMGEFCQIDGIGIAGEDILLEYEQKDNKYFIPLALKQQKISRKINKLKKTIAETQNTIKYFQNREISKYVLQGKFVNDTIKIDTVIQVKLINLQTNDSLLLLTEKDGSFQVGLDESEYIIFGFQQGYLATPQTKISMLGKKINEVVQIDIPIRLFQKTENYLFHNITFAVNSDSIDIKSYEVLQQIFITLQANPKTCVRIEVHTDSRGDDNYNLLLTQKRAIQIVNYLVAQGIATKRLIAKGLGEKELRNKCANGVKCDSFAHFENRRIELEITGYVK